MNLTRRDVVSGLALGALAGAAGATADQAILPRQTMRAAKLPIMVAAANGDMSGCTTTSGLAWKLPGRLGDSPIIGAGCFTDQDVGSAGATGTGEENIKVCGARTIVENLRRGMSPLDAGMDVLKLIVRNYDGDLERLKYVDMTYYVLRKDGAYAGVSLWTGYEPGKPHTIAVHDGTPRLEKTVCLYEGASQEWPPLVAPPRSTL